ncbi:unnamed protein product [Clavelina lepadiformis]|uniref:Uncharacterized protein n=1 Tax=Clavelina lepadiformis TaxID=159417 RepID=A0ABP0GMP5_CLALP
MMNRRVAFVLVFLALQLIAVEAKHIDFRSFLQHARRNHQVQRRETSCNCDYTMLSLDPLKLGDSDKRLCAEVVVRLTNRKWWPKHETGFAQIKAVYDRNSHDWTIWTKNSTVMFGIPHPSLKDRYLYITNRGRSRSSLRLTPPMLEHKIIEGRRDRRYFELTRTWERQGMIIKHKATQRFVGENNNHFLVLLRHMNVRNSVTGACPTAR